MYPYEHIDMYNPIKLNKFGKEDAIPVTGRVKGNASKRLFTKNLL